MNIMSRALAVATITAVMGGVAFDAVAQSQGTAGPANAVTPGRHHGPMDRHGPHGPGFGNPTGRLDRLKTEIGITQAQAAAWDAYAKVVQDTWQQMRDARADRKPMAFLEMSTADRLALLTKRRDQREQAHAAMKTAGDDLLAKLDDAQKVRALLTLPGLAPPRALMRQHAIHRGPMGGPSFN
ncbi:MAG: Spy/CpxP family protein refolding chaperone [Acetobacteraceae bacterium]